MNLLYHYAANQKGFGILNDKEIRLSDIRKSNDYDEMILFFPDVLDEILRVYTDDPFDFKFDGQNGKVALSKLIESTSYMIYTEIENGGFTNFVAVLIQNRILCTVKVFLRKYLHWFFKGTSYE